MHNKPQRRRNGKKTSDKKTLKPLRSPQALSLDAAHLKLIREIFELAMLKRARIERMKALKKMKIAKSRPSSSTSSFFAMVFTVVFFVVIIFQGNFWDESRFVTAVAIL